LAPIVKKMVGYQINYKCALRSGLEYTTTQTVPSGTKILFDNLLYLSHIVTPFPRVSGLVLECIIGELEINLIDHYSYLHWSPDVYEVVIFELEYL